MGLPRIAISSQLGFLATRTYNAKLEGTPPALVLNMKGNNGTKVGLQSTLPHVLIDQTACREAVGIMPPLRSIEKFAAEMNQKGIAVIGRIAREGRQLMAIERGGGADTAIQRIARGKRERSPSYLEIRDIPPPRIAARMGELRVYDRSETVRTKWTEAADTQRYTPGDVKTTWGVKPWIDISVVPGTELEFLDTRGTIVDNLV